MSRPRGFGSRACRSSRITPRRATPSRSSNVIDRERHKCLTNVSSRCRQATAREDARPRLRADARRRLLEALVARLAPRTRTGACSLTLASGRSGGHRWWKPASRRSLRSTATAPSGRSCARGALGFAESYHGREHRDRRSARPSSTSSSTIEAPDGRLPGLLAQRSTRPAISIARRANTRTAAVATSPRTMILATLLQALARRRPVLFERHLRDARDDAGGGAGGQSCAASCERSICGRDHHVLEIGCGWGALAEAIAARAARMSRHHDLRAAACARPASGSRRQGSPTGSRSRFEDYRDTSGSFDRIVSIEMIEAVGEDNWPTYFESSPSD